MKVIKQQPTRRKREEMYVTELARLTNESTTFSRMMGDFTLRISAIESLLLEFMPEFTPETFALRMMSLKDVSAGFQPAEAISTGDLVRVAIQFGIQGEELLPDAHIDRILITDIGSGITLPVSLEMQMNGLKVGEERTFDFFDPTSPETILIARLTVTTISRKPKQEVVDGN